MSAGPKRERGAALIILVAIMGLGATWYMVKSLQERSLNRTAIEREYNVQVLNRAKQALIGYVAAQAAKYSPYAEDNPGALPCPENPGDFDSTTGNDGKTGTACGTSLKVGRFPWRSIGTEKLVDAAGEPLWYVVSTNWGVPSSGNSAINSNSTGQLSVDGVANTAVAIIIAPGPPTSVSTSTNCTAWTQTRPSSGTPDWRNYLECENASSPADTTFVTTNANSAFNDQIVTVTAADLLPGIEAAVAKRIEKEIVPALKQVYTATSWGLTGTSVLYPFAAPFADPSTSAMQGSAGTYAGLLPMNYSETSAGSGTNCASGTRCQASFVSWSTTGVSIAKTAGTATVTASSCAASSSTQLSCTITYTTPGGVLCWGVLGTSCTGSLTVRLSATAQNIGNALRKVVSDLTTRVSSNLSSPVLGTTMASTGHAATTLDGTLPSVSCNRTVLVIGALFTCLSAGSATATVTVPITMFADHPLVDSADSTYGWFTRNKWHELLYYVVASGYSPNIMPTQPSCTTGTNCITVTNATPAGGQRALLILAGRPVNGSTRPSNTLADYLEFGNASGSYENQSATAAVPAFYSDAGAANAYSIALSTVTTTQPFFFKAANANTGASTLTTAATGAKSIVDSSGNAIAAGVIRANGAVQVSYDGTNFVLYKRPFNDRIIVVDTN